METEQIALQRAMAAEIGARLGRAHKPVSWLQREAGVPASTWRKYFVEGAITRDVPLSVVQRIARVLGISAGDLIKLAEDCADQYLAVSMKGLSAAEVADLQAAIDRRRGGPMERDAQARRSGA